MKNKITFFRFANSLKAFDDELYKSDLYDRNNIEEMLAFYKTNLEFLEKLVVNSESEVTPQEENRITENYLMYKKQNLNRTHFPFYYFDLSQYESENIDKLIEEVINLKTDRKINELKRRLSEATKDIVKDFRQRKIRDVINKYK